MATPYELLLGMSLLQEKKRLQHQDTNDSEENSFLQVKVNGQDILVRQSDIEEIISTSQITQMPDTKPWFKGLTSFRGSLLPLVDLSILLSKEDQNNTSLAEEVRILVIKAFDGLLGLSVQKVEGIQHHWLQKKAQDDTNDKTLTPTYCQLYQEQNKQIIPVLDIDGIRQSKEFLNA